jgi:hypothetical protein
LLRIYVMKFKGGKVAGVSAPAAAATHQFYKPHFVSTRAFLLACIALMPVVRLPILASA